MSPAGLGGRRMPYRIPVRSKTAVRTETRLGSARCEHGTPAPRHPCPA
ncbi:hypothetical protein [Streptomyces sp. NPDC046976]